MLAYKLFRKRKDGTLGPLFINRKQVIVPNVWLPAKGSTLSTGDFLSNPKDILHWTLNGLHQSGGSEAIIKKIAHHGYFCDEAKVYDEDFVPALRKIATNLVIGVEDAEYALKQAQDAINAIGN